jgi:acyl carrier protein
MKPVIDHTEILERLRQVVPNKVAVDPELLVPEARLVDIGIDSFSLIELVFLAEEEFKIKIPVEGLEVKTVEDVLDVIAIRLQMDTSATQPGVPSPG